ncbi:DNA-formamidopyrimidine glycosylase family protein [Mucilaginibacter sp.]|uniref:DNA-formamidopyrimidine glycosylase family protein n=1 Tax=Mucilaginibacter sp. TaxID=1882438 RepID=UPI00260F626F|nr:DNA-formamidopyrimidine glycosylase family protein [Mucilaginibacter sp.]MDB4924422.1 Fpg/Nei family glycosylase [Mucilaginibacter sp.]
MPELPDLQAFSHNLTNIFHGKKLDKVEVIVDRKLNVSEKELQQTLSCLEVEQFKRAGKELHIIFKGGHSLGLHLMLHGQLVIFKEADTPPKNQIINLLFEDGTRLALTDFQKAATPTLDPETSSVPDALDTDTDYLSDKLSKTKTPVKTVIMDQKIIRGIGNAYADEILWNARISPFSAANKIPKDQIKILAKSIKKVLINAEKQILKIKSDIISGEVRDFMEVHQHGKKQTSTGAAIHHKELSSRSTYYTDEQELFN